MKAVIHWSDGHGVPVDVETAKVALATLSKIHGEGSYWLVLLDGDDHPTEQT